MKTAVLVAVGAVGVSAKIERCPVLEAKKEVPVKVAAVSKNSKLALLAKLKGTESDPAIPMYGETGMKIDEIKKSFSEGTGTVYKDGFYHVNCIDDAMKEFADKHGASGHEKYAAQSTGVSIVKYSTVIAKEDQEEMTHSVCYNFCRRIEGMNFFGIQNGRDCYCTPYYKQQAGAGSENCDLPCDGNNGQMCGGTKKSDMFQMHWCGDAVEGLNSAKTLLLAAKGELKGLYDNMKTCADKLQAAGKKLQEVESVDSGDKYVGDMAMAAKGAAGDYLKLNKKVPSDAKLQKVVDDMPTGDMSSPENAMAAEKSMEDMDLFEALANDGIDDLTEATAACGDAAAPADLESVDKKYFSVAKFVEEDIDDKWKAHSTTCGGDFIGSASIRSTDECAAYCDATVFPKKCMAFQAVGDDLCVLFSEVKDVSTYVAKDCTTPEKTKCYAKMSEAKGFKPAATKEDRCYFK